jgi:hypothetical protein
VSVLARLFVRPRVWGSERLSECVWVCVGRACVGGCVCVSIVCVRPCVRVFVPVCVCARARVLDSSPHSGCGVCCVMLEYLTY